MSSQSVGFMFPVHHIKKRNFQAFFEPEVFQEKDGYKEQHKHPENSLFPEKLVN